MPTPTTYTYPFSAFPIGKVNPNQLTIEIGKSSVSIALDHIDTNTACDIVFKDVLSTSDKTTLDGVVAAHQYSPPVVVAAAPVQFYSGTTAAPTAKDGRATVRNTYANRTTNFKLRAISFQTATGSTGIHNVSPITDADYGDATLTMYDVNGVVTTNPALAVKEVLDWMPIYNFEIIGGYADLPKSLENTTPGLWYISAIGVPDVTAANGGSIDFISEVDMALVTTNRVVSDGRAISYMPYNLQVAPGVFWHTNKIRFIIKHPLNVVKAFQVYIEHFV